MTRPTDGPIPPLPRFAAWLATLGSSQAARADAIGVTQRCVSHWEARERWPTVEALRYTPEGLRALADDLEAMRR